MGSLLGHTEKTVSHSFDLLKSTNFGGKKEEWGAFPYGSTFFCLCHAFLSMPPCFAVPAQILCLQAAQKPMDHLLGPTVFPLQANKLFIFLCSSNTEIFFPPAYPSEFKFTPKRRHIFTTGILFSKVNSHAFSDYSLIWDV